MALDQFALLNLLDKLKLTDVTDRTSVATEALFWPQWVLGAQLADNRLIASSTDSPESRDRPDLSINRRPPNARHVLAETQDLLTGFFRRTKRGPKR